MEATNLDDPSHKTCVDDLLDECWFFGNLLLTPKPIPPPEKAFTRCYSDPCPSSAAVPLPPPPAEGGGRSLVRAPSLPLNIGREKASRHRHRKDEKVAEKREGDLQRRNKKSVNGGNNNGKVLTRTQTLPPCLRHVEVERERETERERESDRKMRRSGGRDSDILPPRHDKVNSRQRPRSKEIRKIYPNLIDKNGRILRRSTSELEIEEVKGFIDLGFKFDNKDSLGPNVLNIIPGLQEKERDDFEVQVKRPYLSEAWLVQSSSPPNWALNTSSQDIKAQIKFWARSVASNVRLEC